MKKILVMNKIVIALFVFTGLLLSACSSTRSDVHQIIDLADKSSTKGVKLVLEESDIQLSYQTNARIYSLHQSADGVRVITRLVLARYGVEVLDAGSESGDDVFSLKLLTAMPDGGACVEGFSVATQNLSYTGSVLTLGITPASVEHCLIVKAELYQQQRDERVFIGEFVSNLGRVDVYAGANEIDNYQLTVDKRDEIRSLEVSVAGLLNNMIFEGAFEETFK